MLKIDVRCAEDIYLIIIKINISVSDLKFVKCPLFLYMHLIVYLFSKM